MSAELKRRLGMSSATALIIGETIAVGIFLTPAGMAKSLGSPLLLLLIWLAVGIMTLCGALCYGELAARYPHAGGSYVYLREAYGKPLAFLYGWKCALVMDPGISAALATGLASYVGYIVKLPPAAVKGVGVAVLLSMAVINILGVETMARTMRWLTGLKLGLLIFIMAWGYLWQLGDIDNLLPFVARRQGSPAMMAGFAGAMVAAFFSFGGWWDVNKLAGEVREPARTLPRALGLGILGVTLIYIATSATFIYLVPIEKVASAEVFAALAGEALFGSIGGKIFSAIVIISIAGSLAAMTMSAPRVYYAMARDGLFFPATAALHPRFGTPIRAIALQTVLAVVLVLYGTFDEIIAYFIFVTILFIALSVVALALLRARTQHSAQFSTPLYPLPAIAFLVLLALLLLLLAGNSPKQAMLGSGMVLLGLPVYYFVFSKADVARPDR